ncbi:MAG: hypothetical protein PWQ28_386 [Candidatus Woesearchaeota archaeon]|nr:hypothetical protein [Candidatus Woesearchaeota archaeon]
MDKHSSIALKVIDNSDIVCEVLDSRFPELTRIKYLERVIKEKGKALIYVLNKCDLISLEQAKEIKKELKPSVFVSVVKHYGITILKKRILSLSKGKAIVGVVGYPNTGKSSIINALSGRKKALVSPTSGFTKGFQYVKLNKKVMLIDSPGMVPMNKKDEFLLGIIGGLDPNKMKDPILVAEKLINLQQEAIIEFYNLKTDSKDSEEILEMLGKSLNFLSSGGKADLDRTARKLIIDWQKGKIHLQMLDKENNLNDLNQINESYEDA